MIPRPTHITRINAIDLLPVAAETLGFHLVLTDAAGLKQVFAVDQDAVTGFLDSHINALSLITLHAAQPKGLVI